MQRAISYSEVNIPKHQWKAYMSLQMLIHIDDFTYKSLFYSFKEEKELY